MGESNWAFLAASLLVPVIGTFVGVAIPAAWGFAMGHAVARERYPLAGGILVGGGLLLLGLVLGPLLYWYLMLPPASR